MFPTAFRTDHIFRIGATHSVCEDYAQSGGIDDAATAIVSDGCSSSPHTDIGARLLTMNFLPWAAAGVQVRNKQLMQQILTKCLYALTLPLEALDATVLIAQATTKTITVTAWGDGFIVLRKRNGTFETHKITFRTKDGKPSPYPVYLAYFMDCPITGWETKLIERLEHVMVQSPIREIVKVSSDGSAEVMQERVAGNRAYTIEAPTEEYDMVMVLSDGLDSFYRTETMGTWKQTLEVDPFHVINDLMTFKSMKGDFLQRRVQKLLKGYERENIRHADDFSVAAIHIEYEDLPCE